MSISEAQKRANVRYQKKNPDVVRRIQYKSRGKNFMTNLQLKCNK